MSLACLLLLITASGAAGGSFGRREGVPARLVDEAHSMAVLHVVFCSDVDTHLWQKRTRAILDTWGARADKLVFVADVARRQDTFVRSHARALAHEEVLVPPRELYGHRTEQRLWALREAERMEISWLRAVGEAKMQT